MAHVAPAPVPSLVELLSAESGTDPLAVDPRSTPGFTGGKRDGAEATARGAAELSSLQERLFAAARGGDEQRRVLLVLQGMDTSGKGGVVRHVIGAVDPQGVRLASFGAPTAQERAHDFLWRVEQRLPGPGLIGVFDRSHYEDVLVQRVRSWAPAEEIERRYGAIVEFEAGLVAQGCTLLKVMLHISRDEQKTRLTERLERPDKYWKYVPGDVDDRLLWDEYQEAYRIAIARTSTPQAPWLVVPADRKWYARLAVQHLLLEALRGIDPRWPPARFDVAHEQARLAAT